MTKKARKIRMRIILAEAMFFLLFSLASAQFFGNPSSFTAPPKYSYYEPSAIDYYNEEQIRTYWPQFGKEQCFARQDFIVQIAPAGCEPLVVRSDLLESQNVPVFCKLQLIKTNPLIEVPEITSIVSTKGFDKNIVGIGFHPARAALRTNRVLLGSPLINNVGYLVVVLKRKATEKEIPDLISANFSVKIKYNIEKAFGVGENMFYLTQMEDSEWEETYKKYGFWKGKGYVRALSIDPEGAEIGIYSDKEKMIGRTRLNPGKSSDIYFLPGFYCTAAFNVHLQNINYPDTSALLNVNGDLLWVKRGDSFGDGACVVDSIIHNFVGSGNLNLRCKDGTRYSLKIKPKVNIEISEGGNKETKEVGVGELIHSDSKKYYLVYTGSYKAKNFIVILNSDKEKNEDELVTLNRQIDSFKREIEKKRSDDININQLNDNLKLIYQGSGNGDGNNLKFKYIGFGGKENMDMNNDQDKLEMYNEAIRYYKKIADDYPYVRQYGATSEVGEIYGAYALMKAANLARDNQQYEDERNLLSTLIEKFPDSGYAEEAKSRLQTSLDVDSIKSIYVKGKTFLVMLQQIKPVGIEDLNAEIIVTNERPERKTLGRYDAVEYTYYVGNGNNAKKQKGIASIEEITEDFVVFKYEIEDKVNFRKIDVGKSDLIGLTKIAIAYTNVKREAQIKIIPKVYGTEQEANVSFNIGIEKRAIQLSDKKIKKLIESYDDQIKKWKTVNDKLGNLIKGWKGTCFAGAAVLIVKNFFNNLGGGARARQIVMERYRKICEEEMAQGKFATATQCFNHYSEFIDKEVELHKEGIQKVNERISEIEKQKNVTNAAGTLDYEKAAVEYRNKIKRIYENQMDNDDKEALEKADYLTLREIDFAYTMKEKNGQISGEMSKKFNESNDERVKTIMDPLREILKREKQANSIENSLGIKVSRPATGRFQLDRVYRLNREEFIQTFKINDSTILDSLFNGSEQIEFAVWQAPNIEDKGKIIKGSGDVIVTPIEKTKEGDYVAKSGLNSVIIKSVQSSDGKSNVTTEVLENDKYKFLASKAKINGFIESSELECSNYYLNPEIKIYETGEYKGLPAIVPLDVREGWYVAAKTSGGVVGVKIYEESGRPMIYYICNVGRNGKAEFLAGGGDDLCGMFNRETGEFAMPCKSKIITPTELVNRARMALMSVAEQRQRNPHSTQYTVPGLPGTFKVSPVGVIPGIQCQDYMSPTDCKILFNLCDPVICPSSRCNLGGTYPVDDVIQTGIIGGLIMCLPNIREGVIMPLCLSGIHAGLQGYISILTATKNCLQESLNTGRSIGICDEIRSVYLCEFFWRQAIPFVKTGIPMIIGAIIGQGTGGGEYLTFQDAWSASANSVNYFVNTYAVNSMEAFQARSLERAGTQICRAFIGSSYPTDLENLIEPDSPTQFHAIFSETPYSGATVPATSMYKVYYHIYAGEDAGTFYRVYLRLGGGAVTPGYERLETVPVAEGYLAKGQTIDQTATFTAPSNYKELCVMINQKEECGFGSVSTSLAVNLLKDAYVAEQATDKIRTEAQCIGTSPSFLPLIQPNLQAGVEQALGQYAVGTENRVYDAGLVRICSSSNPGIATGEEERWRLVGYCGNERIKCWLDAKSVKNSISNLYIENLTLTEAQKIMAEIGSSEGWLTDEQANSKLLVIQSEIKNFLEEIKRNKQNGELKLDKGKLNQFKNDLVEGEKSIEKKALINEIKVRAVLMLADLYEQINRELLNSSN